MNDKSTIFHNPDVTDIKKEKYMARKKHGVRNVCLCEIMQAEIDFLFESRWIYFTVMLLDLWRYVAIDFVLNFEGMFLENISYYQTEKYFHQCISLYCKD